MGASCSFSSISFADGVKISGCPWKHGADIVFTGSNIVAAPGNLKQKETRLNQLLQGQCEVTYAKADYEPDHRFRQDPPGLNSNEREDGDNIIITLMYVQAHIFTLSPLKLTVCCSREPITGEWW
jgi:hypothetical protein